ncbi:cellulose synthase complex periplasmic endoglucanase BcsZ [Peristeroidobacter agariperforans]|uniref:cellulose synthase complex periplasmic endoglucanase BcsZ n=1 Tax=Peristeroidobacter agariperforans TaxID=268404 RepID=UPI00101D6558|nr:cellulose synthase complex periplasmic endoglucanase BcsZ [Peristeroidobacter agariperforans]
MSRSRDTSGVQDASPRRSDKARGILHASALAVWSLLSTGDALGASNDACDSWPAWQRFRQLYMSEDGRIIDASSPEKATVSEGQAYALFFALIGNDRHTFEVLLQWTTNNLAGGDLTRSLPAWRWGRQADGTWGVLDSNAAADADLLMAYTLGEAARLWGQPSYEILGRALASRIVEREIASIPALGATLLPGPHGFVDDGVWRLNPSYVPLQIIRGIQRQTGQDVWNEIARTSEQMIVGAAPRGFAADWVEYRRGKGFATDRATAGVGSYDAIRVYLWAGTLPESDPAYSKLAAHFAPMIESVARRSLPPEKINTKTLATTGDGSFGFSAALLPMFRNAAMDDAERKHRARVEARLLQSNQAYYNDALSLFGLGWLEGRYRFERSALLKVNWVQPC